MGKAKAKATQVKGRLKEGIGHATDDKRMEAEGRAEKLRGKAQEAAAKTKKKLKH
ncbi:hypothetical protein GCM10020000_00530 [Streptomyces olivoverticillatus]